MSVIGVGFDHHENRKRKQQLGLIKPIHLFIEVAFET